VLGMADEADDCKDSSDGQRAFRDVGPQFHLL
jgi:hypothetical protein